MKAKTSAGLPCSFMLCNWTKVEPVRAQRMSAHREEGPMGRTGKLLGHFQFGCVWDYEMTSLCGG